MPELDGGCPAGKHLSIGAIPHAQGTHFRIWAPVAHKVEVVLEGNHLRYPLAAEEDGYFSGLLKEA